MVENAAWFTGSFPVMLEALDEVRNTATHGKERSIVGGRRRGMIRSGVGSIGEIVERTKATVRSAAASGDGTVRPHS